MLGNSIFNKLRNKKNIEIYTVDKKIEFIKSKKGKFFFS